MVLNLVRGTECHKFHICIHRTLRSWKIKCDFSFKFKAYMLYIQHGTIYCNSAQTVPCIICTQNHFVHRIQPANHDCHTNTKHYMKGGEPSRRSPETDSLSPWYSIEPRLKTTALVRAAYIHELSRTCHSVWIGSPWCLAYPYLHLYSIRSSVHNLQSTLQHHLNLQWHLNVLRITYVS